MTSLYEQVMSVEEYLRVEEASHRKHEYVAGRMFAMSGVSVAHATITANLGRFLYDKVISSGCRIFMAEMKLSVKTVDSIYYPDVIVTCEKLQQEDRLTDSPRLVIEILSPSTKNVDLRDKLFAYRTLPSLIEYVIVHQDKMLIETYRRIDNEWKLFEYKAGVLVPFLSLPGEPFELPIEKIYAQLDYSK